VRLGQGSPYRAQSVIFNKKSAKTLTETVRQGAWITVVFHRDPGLDSRYGATWTKTPISYSIFSKSALSAFKHRINVIVRRRLFLVHEACSLPMPANTLW